MQAVCIIIPCYNEEQRIVLDDFRACLKAQPEISFCFVNDGSSDGTDKILNVFEAEFPERVKALHLKVNGGKAEAIRQGVHFVQKWKPFELIGYFDCDLSAPLSEINHLAEELKRTGAFSICFGSRIALMGRRIQRRNLRHYLGRVFATLASTLLRMPIYDTQCGAKLFKPELCEVLFKKPFITRWFFDVEMLFRLTRGFGREKANAMLVECPLFEWVEKKGSKLKVFDFIKVPFQLFRIYFFYRKFDPLA
jgi:dolichyl-phosphate beta-glucosyltransferase